MAHQTSYPIISSTSIQGPSGTLTMTGDIDLNGSLKIDTLQSFSGGTVSVSSNTHVTNVDVTSTFRIPSGASDPTDNLQVGDLFFNTTSGVVRVYTLSGWSNV